MNHIQAHRGPDDEDIYYSKNCILGHRRLSIIDLSKDGRQPFSSDDDRYHLVYNGEIYNYIEIRKILEAEGHFFRTRTDTEVLLKAYLHYGTDCLRHFNGMFAFAIYDAKDQSLFLARDRVGIKPLYYIIRGSTFYFASEIKALSSLPGITLSIRLQSLFDYLVFNRTDIHDETFFNEIRRIPKGCRAVFDREGLRIHRWWNPEDYRFPEKEEIDLDVVLEEIRALFVDAVLLRMRSDVPVGSCLSGGLDSSILLGILSEHHGIDHQYLTFTAAFPGHPVDETAYVDDLGGKYNFQNIRTFPDADTALLNLEQFVYTNDEPTTSPSFYSQYAVMKSAHENGVTVLLDGQGGDENFAGYQYFHGFYLYGLLRTGRFLSFSGELLQCLLRRQHPSVYQTLLFQLMPSAMRKISLLSTIPYIQPDFFHAFIDKSRIYNEFFQAEGLNRSLVRHFQYKLEHLLRMEDRNSMAFSLEARVPYLDYRLVEYVLGLPEKLKIRHGETKYLQKKALGRYTTPRILNRKDKIGFGTPGEAWMRTEKWQRLTKDNYRELRDAFPEVFKTGGRLPEKGYDRWKINQLATWKNLFL